MFLCNKKAIYSINTIKMKYCFFIVIYEIQKYIKIKSKFVSDL